VSDKKTVLIIDDDDSLRRVMELTLKSAGFRVVTATGGHEGLLQFEQLQPQLLITDVQMPDMSGYEVLRRVKQLQPATIVIVITAFGTIEKAVRAMREGAFDYITKPFSKDELIDLVDRAMRYPKPPRPSSAAATQVPGQTVQNQQILGCSAAMNKVRQLVERVASSDATILVQGASGVGKEVISKEIHRLSTRSKHPFVAVNCAAIPTELLESELFGHIKGAFTGAIDKRIGKFEQADGGTLFLDEIGELPLSLQAKLLRALQEKEIEPVGGRSKQVNVRVIAATNRDLEQETVRHNFREDLYYRLAVITLELPPLKERPEDIDIFIEHILQQKTAGLVRITPQALNALRHYDWPGNVRELENCMERMLVLRNQDVLDLADLPSKIFKPVTAATPDVKLPEHGYSLAELEKQAVTEALTRNGWNKTKAAEYLQIPRHVLLYRMDKYAIPKQKPNE